MANATARKTAASSDAGPKVAPSTTPAENAANGTAAEQTKEKRAYVRKSPLVKAQAALDKSQENEKRLADLVTDLKARYEQAQADLTQAQRTTTYAKSHPALVAERERQASELAGAESPVDAGDNDAANLVSADAASPEQAALDTPVAERTDPTA